MVLFVYKNVDIQFIILFSYLIIPLFPSNVPCWKVLVSVNSQVAAEKPNPIIFLKACELLGVKPEEAVHVGDDRRNDIWGARDAGCDAWLWGSDVRSFKEVFLFFFSWHLVLEVYLDTKIIDSSNRAQPSPIIGLD
jgi:hypothetical protein